MEDPLKSLAEAILHLDVEAARRAVRQASSSGIEPLTIIEEGIDRGMTLVGERYQSGAYHMPELLYAEEVMRISLTELNPPDAANDTLHLTSEAQKRLEELSRSWIGPLSSCVTRLFRYDEERKKART